MDDRLADVERNLAELQRGMTEFRQDVAQRMDKGFRWSIVTMAVGLIITWFGIYMLLSRSATLLKKFLLS